MKPEARPVPKTYASYLSARSAGGYPYIATAWLELRRAKKTRRGEGYLYWHPVGLGENPGQVQGIPGSWTRAGTERAKALLIASRDDPRPWEKYLSWQVRTNQIDPHFADWARKVTS